MTRDFYETPDRAAWAAGKFPLLQCPGLVPPGPRQPLGLWRSASFPEPYPKGIVSFPLFQKTPPIARTFSESPGLLPFSPKISKMVCCGFPGFLWQKPQQTTVWFSIHFFVFLSSKNTSLFSLFSPIFFENSEHYTCPKFHTFLHVGSRFSLVKFHSIPIILPVHYR